MAEDKRKKSKVETDDSDDIDEDLVLSIEKLQEIQDELEKVHNDFCFDLILLSLNFRFLVLFR